MFEASFPYELLHAAAATGINVQRLSLLAPQGGGATTTSSKHPKKATQMSQQPLRSCPLTADRQVLHEVRAGNTPLSLTHRLQHHWAARVIPVGTLNNVMEERSRAVQSDQQQGACRHLNYFAHTLFE